MPVAFSKNKSQKFLNVISESHEKLKGDYSYRFKPVTKVS